MHHVIARAEAFVVHDLLSRRVPGGVALALVAVKDLMVGPEGEAAIQQLETLVQNADHALRRAGVIRQEFVHTLALAGIVEKQDGVRSLRFHLADAVRQQRQIAIEGRLGLEGGFQATGGKGQHKLALGKEEAALGTGERQEIFLIRHHLVRWAQLGPGLAFQFAAVLFKHLFRQLFKLFLDVDVVVEKHDPLLGIEVVGKGGKFVQQQ